MVPTICAAVALSGILADAPLLAAQPAPDRAEAYYLFLSGRQLENEGDVEGALAAHRRALVLAPRSAEVHAELAGLLARQNRGAEALVEGQAALAIDPANREAHRILGFVFAAMVDADPGGEASPQAVEHAGKAAAHFEQAGASQAGDPAVQLTLGRLYVMAGDFDRAAAILREFLLDQPGYPEAILLLTDALAGRGDVDEAIAALEQAMAGEPGLSPAAFRLAELYEDGGRWSEAADLYGAIVGQSPRMAVLLRPRQASALVAAGRLDQARALLRELVATSPADAGVWFLLSQTELRAGMLGDAEQAARRLAAIDPDDPRGAAALADVLIARREFPRAAETLQPLLARSAAGTLAPGADAMIASRAAHVFGELGRHDAAVDALERAARRQPGEVDLQFELGAAYERARRHADAERVFRAIVAAHPSHALALNYLGYMLAERGERLEEAVSLVTRALAIEPDNPSFHDSLGWAYYQQRRYDLAEPHLARAAAGAGTSSVILDHYGDVLLALQRPAEAIAAWQKALAGDRHDIDPSRIAEKIARAKAIGR
jgi:tetratricopeptide (TPR) repeat protein